MTAISANDPSSASTVSPATGPATVPVSDRVAEQSAAHAVVVALLTLVVPAVGGAHIATLEGAALTVSAAVLGAIIQVGRNAVTNQKNSKAWAKSQAELARARADDAAVSAKLKSVM